MRITPLHNLTDAELTNRVANMAHPSALEIELALRLEQVHDRLLEMLDEIETLQGGTNGDDT